MIGVYAWARQVAAAQCRVAGLGQLIDSTR